MTHPDDDATPNHRHGPIHDYEQPNSASSLIPRSARSYYSSHYPSTYVGEQQRPLHAIKTSLRGPEEGGGISRRLAVAVVCSLAFLAGSGISWSRSDGNRSTSAAAGSFVEVASHASIPAAESQQGEPSSDVGDDLGDAVADLQFTALNFYHVRDGKPGQDYPWLKDVKLIEPHRDTTLAVVGAREGFNYRWEVRAGSSRDSGKVGEVQARATGAVTIVVLTQLDENLVVLEEIDGDGKVTNRLEETVMVKYVRREIRTLTDDEREEVLDAMFQLWAVRVDDGHGKEIYGEDYADIFVINRMHYKAATSSICDHFHDGMGFLVSHTLITNTCEFSLQLVNPKLTMPYWDFTIETTAASAVQFHREQPFTRTELLDPAWFGTADLQDHVLKDGRWAYTEVPRAKDENARFPETNVYAKLRSPWNTNDREYLSRGVGKACQTRIDAYLVWPSCPIHYDLLTTNHDYYSWAWDTMADPHGGVHLWMGGYLDCDLMYNKIGHLVGADIANHFAYLANAHRKGLFCEETWICNRTADDNETPYEIMDSGTCGCLGYDLTQGDDYKTVMTKLDYAEFFIGGFSEDIQRQVVSIVCSGVINFGEQAHSSSSLDPMFWPMHGTMERIFQFGILTEQVTNFSWPDEDTAIILPDGTSYNHYISTSSNECNGHRGSDVFPFGLTDDIDGFEIKTAIRSNPVTGNTITNRDMLKVFDPRSDSMNYVYDTFKWDHCASEGYDFDDAWGEQKPSPRKNFHERDGPLSAVYTSFKRKMAERMENEGNGMKG